MYVCSCFAVTHAEIEFEANCGAATVDEVGARCDAGLGCGGCHEKIVAILRGDSACGRIASVTAA